MKKVWWIVSISMVLVLGASAIALYFFLYPLKYEDVIIKYAEMYDIDAVLTASVINVESGFDKDVVSSKGAQGLMQMMPSTACDIAKRLGESEYDLKNPDISIRYGVYYLRYLMNVMGGDEKTVLACYNAGLGNVREWLTDSRYSSDGVTIESTPFNETNDYITKVQKNKKVYKNRIK